jgi:Dyp-type peroxidase family
MLSRLQEGIYYRTIPTIGNSLCFISLRIEGQPNLIDVGFKIASIWNSLKKLKNGIITDLDIDPRHRKIGNLTVLIAYGSRLFDLPGIRKRKPMNFADKWNFNPPSSGGGGNLLEAEGISYSAEVVENHLLGDHVVFQFIADSEFYTTRAAVAVWKELHREEKVGIGSPLRITGLYQGFQRPDKRNWFGFHDGVSNLKSYERPYVISIDSKYLHSQDEWLLHGTYLAFIRFVMDLKKWDDTPIEQQEKIIGRHKLTGCPLVRLDGRGRGIKDTRCPVPGTSEIVDPGNEYFRDHPPYGFTRETKLLQFSHIGTTRPIERIPLLDKRSLRIFRQGFEFLLASNTKSGFVVGLNFISFQNTPERLFRALTYQNLLSKKSNMNSPIATLEQFTSVLTAGIFLVPPVVQDEPFPGAKIFFDKKEIRNFSGSL